MNRKKESTQVASLASCLSFAAQLLCSTATLQETFTKSALAPMVVEAHKCGQEAKRSEISTPIDIRRLLMELQIEHDTKLCRQSPLANLYVADLTWDFEGIVADTLTIEIEELQDRAATSTINICVVLSVSSQLSAGGQAVIWFSPDSTCIAGSRKKRQILLYVCPGRVKVVKSASSLIKKMYDELPVLREDGATYNVWAVVMGSKSQNHQKEERGTNQSSVSQEHSKNPGIGESITASKGSSNDFISNLSVIDTNKPISVDLTTERRTSVDSDNQNEAQCTFKPVDTIVDVDLTPRGDDDNNLLSQSSHFSVYPDVTHTKKNLTPSIFSFGMQQRNSTDLQRMSSGQAHKSFLNDGAAGTKRDGAVVGSESKSAYVNCGDDGDVSESYQHQISRPRRTVVSSSLANLSTFSERPCFEAATGSNLEVNGLTWRSYDGKVVRKKHQRARDFDVDSEQMKDSTAIVLQKNIVDEQEGFIDDPSCRNEQENFDQHGQIQNDDSFKVALTVENLLEYDEAQTRQDEECVRLSRQTEIASPYSDLASGFSQVKNSYDSNTDICRSLDEGTNVDGVFTENVIGDRTNETKYSADAVYISDSCVLNSDEDSIRAAQVAVVDFALRSQSPTQDESSVHKPRPRVNYRDKLGSQIWWELEYTAKILEREEMMERQQELQTRRRHNENYYGRLACIYHPRRMSSEDELKHFQSGIQREEINVTAEKVSGEELESRKLVITGTPQPGRRQLSIDEGYSLSIAKNGFALNANVVLVDRGPKVQPRTTASLSESHTDFIARLFTEDSEEIESQSFFQRSDEDNLVSAFLFSKSHEPKKSSVVCTATQAMLPAMLPPVLSQRCENESVRLNRQERPISTTSVTLTGSGFVEPQHVRPQVTAKSASLIASNYTEGEDGMLTQMMGTSTRTSYNTDRDATLHLVSKDYDVLTSKIASATPFSICGRVPIRPQPVSATDESLSIEQCPTSTGSNHTSDESVQTPHEILSSHHAFPSSQQKSVAPLSAPVAAFVALKNNVTTADKSRELRLKELRQKKLQKLQQVRESALQQQKEKQQSRRPLSFATIVYTKKASNRQLIQNALEFTLLAGGSMQNDRMLALQALARSTCDNYIVLLKSAKELKFRALYENHVDRDSAVRIFSLLSSTSSRAPITIGNSEMISQFFKYSSAKKQFLPVPTRSFTVKTDACALADPLIFKGKSVSALACML